MALTLSSVSQAVPKAVSGPIFEKATEASLVMQLAQRAPSTLTGSAIPVTVGDVEADWVTEGGEKHVADAGAATLIMEPKKIAVIILASEEFANADPAGLFDLIQEKAGEALARAFDIASLFGKRTVGAGAGPFDTFIGQTTQVVMLGTSTQEEGGLEGDLVGAQGLTPDWTGYALDRTMRARLANQRDALGRALMADTSTIGGSRALYGTAIHKGDPTAAGFGGDWRQCAYGVGMDLTMKRSDQATVRVGADLVPLWQTNQIGILLEASYGFVAKDPAIHFVQFDEPNPVTLAAVAPNSVVTATPTSVAFTGTGFGPSSIVLQDGSPISPAAVNTSPTVMTAATYTGGAPGVKQMAVRTGAFESQKQPLTVTATALQAAEAAGQDEAAGPRNARKAG
jgi:HK97 family phage major capsid protein